MDKSSEPEFATSEPPRIENLRRAVVELFVDKPLPTIDEFSNYVSAKDLDSEDITSTWMKMERDKMIIHNGKGYTLPQ